MVGVDTECSVETLIGQFRAIESAHGRTREGSRFSSRTLDIDLLTYGDQVLDRNGLHLPRSEITRYAFVLLPLSELAGESLHPELGKSYRTLWQEFDQSAQRLWPVPFDSRLPYD